MKTVYEFTVKDRKGNDIYLSPRAYYKQNKDKSIGIRQNYWILYTKNRDRLS